MTEPHWPSLRPTLVGYGRLLEAITVEGDLLVHSAIGADPRLGVPGCPGLTVGDTVRHTGSVYHQVLDWIRLGERPDDWQRHPDGDGFFAFHNEARLALATELAAHEPDEPCSTWWPAEQNYGFWRRRMAHETTVHRVDVQAAIGMEVGPVAVDFAADGIDEVLALWFSHRLAELGMTATTHGAVGFETANRAWLAILGRVRSTARRVHPADARAADARVTGDPTAVYLWLWGRLPNSAVETDGDFDAIAQLWALLRPAMQGR